MLGVHAHTCTFFSLTSFLPPFFTPQIIFNDYFSSPKIFCSKRPVVKIVACFFSFKEQFLTSFLGDKKQESWKFRRKELSHRTQKSSGSQVQLGDCCSKLRHTGDWQELRQIFANSPHSSGGTHSTDKHKKEISYLEPQPQRILSLAGTLILNLQSPELRENSCVLFQTPVL